VGFTIYGKTDYFFNYVTPLNTWFHLAFVKTGAGISLYTNGVFVTSNSGSNSLNATAIGCDQYTVYSDYLDATLNDLRVYNQALTQQQIANIYAYGRISPIPSVTLTTPTNGASFVVSTNVTLTANVIANGQSVADVQFYAETQLLGETASAPYAWTWTNVPAGYYSLTANVVYNGLNTNASPAVGIYTGIATNQPTLGFSTANGSLQLSWPADHTGWLLEVQTNSNAVGLSTNWAVVGNSTATNAVVVPILATNGSVFYRLAYP